MLHARLCAVTAGLVTVRISGPLPSLDSGQAFILNACAPGQDEAFAANVDICAENYDNLDESAFPQFQPSSSVTSTSQLGSMTFYDLLFLSESQILKYTGATVKQMGLKLSTRKSEDGRPIQGVYCHSDSVTFSLYIASLTHSHTPYHATFMAACGPECLRFDYVDQCIQYRPCQHFSHKVGIPRQHCFPFFVLNRILPYYAY